MMKFILLFLILSVIKIFPQAKSIEPGLYLTLSKDSCNVKAAVNTIVYSSDTLCIEQKPSITVKDIETCNTQTATLDGKELYVLNIALNDSAKTKFRNITEQNTGKKIVLIIDQKAIMVAVIRDPVTIGRLTVSGASRNEIDNWAEKLKEAMKNK